MPWSVQPNTKFELFVPDDHKHPNVDTSPSDESSDTAKMTGIGDCSVDDFESFDQSILSQPPNPTDVFNLLRDKSYNWDAIGREFTVPFGYREGLTREGVMLTNESKLEHVIMKWVESKCSDVTWNKVIDVLRKLQYNDLMEPTNEILKTLSVRNQGQAKNTVDTVEFQE